MCYGCYEEVGKPTIINEKTKVAADLIKALYETDDGGVGGYGHIVFDDWNIENGSIDFCISEAESMSYKKWLCEETRVASLSALNTFRELSEDERYSTLAIIGKFINY